ncbi:hypothetical protein [Halosimplex salinum]|uniref:hypothetical protein n=1 Tax=Halosimplex salinum TaxID=1710538 RepID=UPI000F48D657|nr:hypothetical protein [Halosimplex salinum]
MRWPVVVIGVLVAAVLLPMWVIAIQGEAGSEEVEIDRGVSEIRPLDGFLDTPNKLSPSQVGVIVWVALFGLYGVVAVAHRFVNEAVRPADDAAVVADGRGSASSWFDTEDRWVVEYADASEQVEGIVAMGGLTVLAIAFAALFTGEYFTLARTQYFGVYAAGMFFSLAGLTVAYYAWFMPHVEVVEEREHAR